MTKGWLNDDFDVPGDITAGGIENTPIGSTTTANGYFTEIGAGTVAVPHGAVGSGIVAVEGANAAVGGPHMQFTTASDDYPLMQILPWTHDNVNIYFDGYRDSGGQKSSSSNGNFRIKKGSDVLQIAADTGIASGSAATYTDVWQLTADGEVTKPLQPCFIASKLAAQTNVTGNNTAVTVTFGTEIKDQGSDYSSPTFTSPVTGSYPLCTHFDLESVGGMTTGLIRIRTSNRQWGKRLGTDQDSSGRKGVELDCVADMDAADTAFVEIVINGIGADTADIAIDGSTVKYGFAGYLQA